MEYESFTAKLWSVLPLAGVSGFINDGSLTPSSPQITEAKFYGIPYNPSSTTTSNLRIITFTAPQSPDFITSNFNGLELVLVDPNLLYEVTWSVSESSQDVKIGFYTTNYLNTEATLNNKILISTSKGPGLFTVPASCESKKGKQFTGKSLTNNKFLMSAVSTFSVIVDSTVSVSLSIKAKQIDSPNSPVAEPFVPLYVVNNPGKEAPTTVTLDEIGCRKVLMTLVLSDFESGVTTFIPTEKYIAKAREMIDYLVYYSVNLILVNESALTISPLNNLNAILGTQTLERTFNLFQYNTNQFRILTRGLNDNRVRWSMSPSYNDPMGFVTNYSDGTLNPFKTSVRIQGSLTITNGNTFNNGFVARGINILACESKVVGIFRPKIEVEPLPGILPASIPDIEVGPVVGGVPGTTTVPIDVTLTFNRNADFLPLLTFDSFGFVFPEAVQTLTTFPENTSMTGFYNTLTFTWFN